MDMEAFKALLDSQERCLRYSFDVAVEQMKARVQDAETNTQEVIRSLEFAQAEIMDLKNEVKVLRKSEAEKRTAMEALQARVADLERRCNYQEDYSRRNNLRITGFLEQEETKWEQTSTKVSKLLENKLQLPSIKLERAHRVGVPTHSHPRPVVARFVNYSDREAVLRNARKLKGTGIYINEDLCPASLEVKKKQFPLLKKAREEGKVAFFRHTRLIIKEKTTQVSSSSGPIAGSLRGDRDSGVRHGEAVGGSEASLVVAPGTSGPASVAGEDSVARPRNNHGGGGATGVLPRGNPRSDPPVASGDGAPVLMTPDNVTRKPTVAGEEVESSRGITTRSQKPPKKNK